MNRLELKNIQKSYGNHIALQGVNFIFEPGIYGLIGPNGAGKSTLLKMIATIHGPDQGYIFFNDKDIFFTGSAYRQKIGYMPQHQEISLRLSVRSFLNYMAALKGFSGKVIDQQVHRVIDEFRLSTVATKRMSDLSGGFRQRALLAQAFLDQPDILILDEPTVGLDPSERKNLRALIGEQAAGAIVIIATHMMSDLQRLAENILFIKQGSLIHHATQLQLIEETKVYTANTTPEEIAKIDPDMIVLDSLISSSDVQIRFLSHKTNSSWKPVQANLDDAYIEWIEHVSR
jgi:ABC-type multidrug transport system ATPase subunit